MRAYRTQRLHRGQRFSSIRQNVRPEVQIEIEDIRAELTRLQALLDQ